MLSKLLVGDKVEVASEFVGWANGLTGEVIEASFNSYRVQLPTGVSVWFHRTELKHRKDKHNA